MRVEMLPLMKADGMGKAYSCPSVFSPIHGLPTRDDFEDKAN